MSPEQCKGVHVDHRTDVYAFGCIAYRMLAGVPLFDAASALELMMAHVSAPPAAPSSRCPELGSKYDEPILRILAKDPDERPQSMQEAYELLAEAAEQAEQAPRDTKIPVSSLLRDMVQDREREPSASVDLSKLRRPSQSEHRSRGGAWGWRLALGAALVAGVAWLIVARSPRPATSPEPAVAPTPTAADTADKPPASASRPSESQAPPAPSTVAVTVRSKPALAEIHFKGKRLGTAPGPVSIPRGDRTETLVIKAPGYKPARLVVHPTDDLTAEVTLVALAQRPVNRAVSRDLENPY
jgi:serine/threonine protein kinase